MDIGLIVRMYVVLFSGMSSVPNIIIRLGNNTGQSGDQMAHTGNPTCARWPNGPVPLNQTNGYSFQCDTEMLGRVLSIEVDDNALQDSFIQLALCDVTIQ